MPHYQKTMQVNDAFWVLNKITVLFFDLDSVSTNFFKKVCT